MAAEDEDLAYAFSGASIELVRTERKPALGHLMEESRRSRRRDQHDDPPLPVPDHCLELDAVAFDLNEAQTKATSRNLGRL
jgi:hypothetical protein